MLTEMRLTNEAGVPWRVRIVYAGDKYGLKDCLTHDETMPLVEFYDMGYPDIHGPGGQFVQRYNLDTLVRDRPHPVGLNLYGGEPRWEIDAESLMPLVCALRIVLARLTA
jgi:hypothetical protein